MSGITGRMTMTR